MVPQVSPVCSTQRLHSQTQRFRLCGEQGQGSPLFQTPPAGLQIARLLPGVTAAPLSVRSLAVMLGDAPPETHAASKATCNIRPQTRCPESHVIWEPHLTKQEFRDTFAQAPDSPACTTSAGQSGFLPLLSHVVCCVYTEPMGLPHEKQTRTGPL